MEESALIKSLEPFVEKIKLLYQQQLKDNGINASGKLSSFDYSIDIEDHNIRIYFELEEYWRFVERGRKAGSKQPPIAPIEKWIKIKPIVPRPRNGKIPSTKQLAFAISKSIGQNGIKGKYPLSNTLKSTNVTNIVDQIKSTIIEKINIEIKDVIEQSLQSISK